MPPTGLPGEAWAVGFGFETRGGASAASGLPVPGSLVAVRLGSGQRIRLRGGQLRACRDWPARIRDAMLLIESGQAIGLGAGQLGWGRPARIVDLEAEARALANAQPARIGPASNLGEVGPSDLLAMLAPSVGRGWSRPRPGDLGIDLPLRAVAPADEEQTHCATLARLFEAIGPSLDLNAALVRGAYTVELGRMYRRGVPIDAPLLRRYVDFQAEVRRAIIARSDLGRQVFRFGRFASGAFVAWLAAEGIAWPRLSSGQLDLDRRAFRAVESVEPRVRPLRELLGRLDRLGPIRLQWDEHGRCRADARPFASKTGRNQPSSVASLFGLPGWTRGFLMAPPGLALIEADWAHQELAIAAALSDDPALQQLARSTDPYLRFGQQVGLVDPVLPDESLDLAENRTRFAAARKACKAVVLGSLYGIGPAAIAQRLQCSPSRAEALLTGFRRSYRRFCDWSDAMVRAGQLRPRLESPLGWPYAPRPHERAGTLRNFPIQAAGADLLRAAVISAAEEGLEILATVHDSLLFQASADGAEETIAQIRSVMESAASDVLGHGPLPVRITSFTGRAPLEGPDARFFDEIVGLIQRFLSGPDDISSRESV